LKAWRRAWRWWAAAGGLLLVGCRAPLGAQSDAAPTQAPPASVWRKAVARAGHAVHGLREQTRAELGKGVSDAKFVRGDRTRREVALTFDDGPHPGKTEPLLAILKEHGVPATFFVVGKMAERYAHLVRAELADGHEVGNHTYHHVNLTRVKPHTVAEEIAACDEVLKGISGQSAHLFRPPGGQYSNSVAEIARRVGYTTILWTADPGDYASPGGDVILHRTLHDVANGGIILLHDGIDETLAILPRLIRYLHAQGYRFVTTSELMAGVRPPTATSAPAPAPARPPGSG